MLIYICCTESKEHKFFFIQYLTSLAGSLVGQKTVPSTYACIRHQPPTPNPNKNVEILGRSKLTRVWLQAFSGSLLGRERR
jgi:hypothetical protein